MARTTAAGENSNSPTTSRFDNAARSASSSAETTQHAGDGTVGEYETVDPVPVPVPVPQDHPARVGGAESVNGATTPVPVAHAT
nr:hypothetical protein [Nocardia salmonicida]